MRIVKEVYLGEGKRGKGRERERKGERERERERERISSTQCQHPVRTENQRLAY